MKPKAFFLAIVLALTACDQSATQNASTQSTMSQASAPTDAVASATVNPNWETLLVGSEISYAPFEFKDDKGQPIGFEVDLLNAIGQAEQMNVQFIHEQRTKMTETLNSGKFAVFASTLSITPERAAEVDFTQPYTDYYRAVMILDTPENKNIKTVADLNGKKIATNKSSQANIKFITQMSGADKVVSAESFYLAMKEVYTGNATGVLGDNNSLLYYGKRHSDMKTRIIRTDDQPRPLAFAVKKGNTELLNKLNSGLEKVKKDGTYDKIYNKWFKD